MAQVRYHYAKQRRGDKYIVFRTEGENWDREERKAKSVAKRMGLTLAGGSFVGKVKPHNFKTNYVVIKVPTNTKPLEPSEHDRFIQNLIAYESGELSDSQTQEFFKKNKSTLQRLQGHYGRRLN